MTTDYTDLVKLRADLDAENDIDRKLDVVYDWLSEIHHREDYDLLSSFIGEVLANPTHPVVTIALVIAANRKHGLKNADQLRELLKRQFIGDPEVVAGLV